MLEKQSFCLKIRDIYPEIGACGTDLKVDFDDQQNRWVVHLDRNDKQF